RAGAGGGRAAAGLATRRGAAGAVAGVGVQAAGHLRAADAGAAAGVHAAGRWRTAPAGVAHLDVVAHVAHAEALVGEVLGAVLHPAMPDAAGERRHPVADFDADVACVQVVGLGEAVVEVLADAFVGAAVVARAHAAVTARAVVAVGARDRAVVQLVVAAAAVVALEVARPAPRAALAAVVAHVVAALVEPVLRRLGPVLAHAQHVLCHRLHVGDRGAGKVLVPVVSHGRALLEARML